ncbi:MlaE family ABC transporter permease [Pseudonocardia sp. Cha107L01]|uniref:MlaE family ABC transporter permease n=1 Tax=Pseudonocardia sp. Cha107L01 TaxID=3457576 RepID=UPI00403E7A04
MTSATDADNSAAPSKTVRQAKAEHSYGYEEGILHDLGEVFRFTLRVARAMPRAWTYPSEVFRQAGILILGSSSVIILMEIILAAEIALEGHYLLRQLGVGSYTGLFTSLGGYNVHPVMFGWILSSKVGCGLVAEIGAMRISDEVDALEVMGIDSMVYLVATRVWALILYIPFIFMVFTALAYVVYYVLNVLYFQSYSYGAFLDVHFGFITWPDEFAQIWHMYITGIIIVLVSCYYGYTAKGGPVGVGRNTAKSMIINLAVISLVGAVINQFFFSGYGPRAPIAR